MEEILLYLLAKYKGNWMKVYYTLAEKKPIKEDDIAKIVKKLPKAKYVSLINIEYPEFMKGYYKPAFVLIKEGKKWFVPYGENLSKKFEVKPDAEEEYQKNLKKYC